MPRPDDILLWADDTTWTSGVRSGENTKIAPTTNVAEQGLVGGDPVRAEYLNYVLNNYAHWIDWLAGGASSVSVGEANGLFGDASDGNVTISPGTTTLTRDMFYGDLDVEAGATLRTGGFRVFVTGTLANEGAIHHDGDDGETPSPEADSGAGGAGYAVGTLAAQFAGGAGGEATLTTGENGDDGDDVTTGSLGGAGGDGGDTTGLGLGGNGGSVGTAVQGPPRHAWQAIEGVIRHAGVTALLSGGGGGGGGGSGTGRGAGGGGAGGGVVMIAARRIVNNGTISADGGNGGNGGGAGAGSGGAGGGGGGGGVVLIVTRDTVTGTGTITAAGGTGGTATNGGSTNGANGSAGTVIELVI